MRLRFCQRRLFAGLMAWCVFALTGCGDGKPPVIPISGKVVYADGKPLTEGMIIFNPIMGSDPAKLIVIQKDGSFSLVEDGVPAGDYRISLSPSEEAPPPVAEGGGEPKGSTFQVPDQYLDPETSGWTATVAESGNQPFTFTISKSNGKK